MFLSDKVELMMRARGYAKTKIFGSSNEYIHGFEQSDRECHPRPDADALAYLDTRPNFSNNEVHHAMQALCHHAHQLKMKSGSSIIYIYSFSSQRQRLNSKIGRASCRERV